MAMVNEKQTNKNTKRKEKEAETRVKDFPISPVFLFLPYLVLGVFPEDQEWEVSYKFQNF